MRYFEIQSQRILLRIYPAGTMSLIHMDFKNQFGHYLMVVNQNTLDEVRVTVILAKERSQSSESEISTKVQ